MQPSSRRFWSYVWLTACEMRYQVNGRGELRLFLRVFRRTKLLTSAIEMAWYHTTIRLVVHTFPYYPLGVGS
jgi:hypothetical protein